VTQVSKLLALQGAQLWNHGDLQPEVVPEDGDLWSKVQHEPPVPALDLEQLRMIKAELRALVPAFPMLDALSPETRLLCHPDPETRPLPGMLVGNLEEVSRCR